MWESDESCSSRDSPLDFTPVQAATCQLSLPYHLLSPPCCVQGSSPATSSSRSPVSPQLCWCCQGPNLFFPLRLSSSVVVAMLPARTACKAEWKTQKQAVFSTAGHKMLLSGCVRTCSFPCLGTCSCAEGLAGPFVCGSVQSYLESCCGYHRQSTAGQGLKCCDVWGSLIWYIVQKVVVGLLALHRQSF